MAIDMMEPGDFTTVGVVILVVTLLLIAYDVYLYVKGKTTLSFVLTRFSYYSPALPFLAGFLCGHWFW